MNVYIDTVWDEDLATKTFKNHYVICDAETGRVKYYPWDTRKSSAIKQAKVFGHEIVEKPEGVETRYGVNG